MSRQIDTKNTKQIRIDTGIHKLIKVESAKEGLSIKSFVESKLLDLYSEKILTENFKKTDNKNS